jgi:DNA polymerase
MEKSVRRCQHKMKAFVRFRRIESAAPEAKQETYVAWFEPQHHIVEATAPFFTRRFTGMRWSIVTPGRSAHWDGTSLRFAAGASARDCPNSDALETYWRVYYANIFNPARLKLDAMRAEMPVRYWRNLPESRLIPELVSGARRAPPAGTATSIKAARRCVAAQRDGEPLATIPENLQSLRPALQACVRCDLCHTGTGAVPGEGPSSARLMIVGEQPGDQEDLAGRPFVGPAGQVLDEVLNEAGIGRESVYLTNAVKHFKHVLRGKRRIHQKPNAQEIEQCRWWLDIERQLVAPRVTVALGTTAARAVLGRTVRVNEARGTAWTDHTGGTAFVTIHPANLLRLPDRQAAARERARFIEDLKRASAGAGHAHE